MGYITRGSVCIGRGYNLSPIYGVYHWRYCVYMERVQSEPYIWGISLGVVCV